MSRGEEPADLLLTGARVLNVFTGQIRPAAVAIAAGRIAAVDTESRSARQRHDLEGALIVPGLIDAHCHADMLCTPSDFLEAVALRGTTTVVLDTVTLTTHLDDAAMGAVMDGLATAATKVLWGLRATGDAGTATGDAQTLPLARLRALLRRDDVSGAGELTGWRAVLEGDRRLAGFLAEVADAGLRIDGHAPGASARTLAQQVALGITSDHEAIDGDELERRVALGLWTMLRHSSLRPDGVTLGRAVAELGLETRRLLLTCDGVLPPELAHRGHLDETVRRVVEGGIDAVEAVRMATLHPATYLGLDAHLGAVAPGRCADLVVTDDLADLRARRVMADGRWVTPGSASGGALDWAAMKLPITLGKLGADVLERLCESAPPLKLHGVLARRAPAAARAGRAALLALVARDGSWAVGTTIDDIDVRGVASTFTGSRDVLLVGRDPGAMLGAYAEVVRLGGGMACPGASIALPTFGHLRPGPIDRLAAELEAFDRAAGVPAWPPFAYLTTFLSLPGLPGVCLTPDGLTDVRSGERLAAPTPL